MQSKSKPKAGRPIGSASTESSNIVSRIRAARGISQDELAKEWGLPYSTLQRYDSKKLIPRSGPVRAIIEETAKKAGLEI